MQYNKEKIELSDKDDDNTESKLFKQMKEKMLIKQPVDHIESHPELLLPHMIKVKQHIFVFVFTTFLLDQDTFLFFIFKSKTAFYVSTSSSYYSELYISIISILNYTQTHKPLKTEITLILL
jgi:hypothetical protein